MKDRVILGIGGAGCAIAAHIDERTDKSLNIQIIENNCVPRETTLPIHYISEGIYSDESLLDKFLSPVISQNTSGMIIVSSFNGLAKDVVPIVKRYASQRSINCVLAGVTPFNFEGTKKNSDTADCIKEMEAQGVEVVTFSNNDLLSIITPTTPLEEAIKINYDKILSEVVLPRFPELEFIPTDEDGSGVYREKKMQPSQDVSKTIYANPMTEPEKRSGREILVISTISLLFIIIAILMIAIIFLSVSAI